MVLTVNGETTESAATTVAELLRERDLDGGHVAVAVNFEVVPRRRWASAALAAGDAVEIISPRQGG
ncbi:sulfur carrier protein ThiS [Phreatobacter cathodiphilus]|uniref:Thiamine biosynthesis protein ThiS n=1 Tax=Phreatobacter cathodiphilus TaxID=1868589 RepID=A0A2S0NDW6_9HYPH|nr:sulfur carrier protein ThiS [Phreatobacter cathodiphilus]AVO46369.1 thiamine biosynthesis protein ThiS [Phreatobacter cathodiphilus]